jgi:hypothetical protein
MPKEPAQNAAKFVQQAANNHVSPNLSSICFTRCGLIR